MPKYRFDEIAINSTDKGYVDEYEQHFYIGLEHLDSGTLKVSRWGSDVPISGEKLKMKKGDVLFGKRNTYLRRAAIAPHDGFFSAHGMVLRPKTDVVNADFFPLFISSDYFFDEAIRISVGSLSPTVNWKDLRDLEFVLPSLSEQRKLAKQLSSINETIDAYKKLATKSDELVKARFVEMFGDFKTNPKRWPIFSFDEIATIDANMTTEYERYANYPHIGIDSIEKDTGLLKGYRTVAEDHVISGKYIFTPEHIIYSKIRPNLNKVALPTFVGLCSADAYPILPKRGKCNRVFLAYNMRSRFFLDYVMQFCNRSNMPKVNRKEVSGFKTPLPPIELQDEFSLFVSQVDKSKVALQESLNKLESLRTAILRECFTPEDN